MLRQTLISIILLNFKQECAEKADALKYATEESYTAYVLWKTELYLNPRYRALKGCYNIYCSCSLKEFSIEIGSVVHWCFSLGVQQATWRRNGKCLTVKHNAHMKERRWNASFFTIMLQVTTVSMSPLQNNVA